jgi:prepilin-type N-terminal cleavage/methylation domain-containing protein
MIMRDEALCRRKRTPYEHFDAAPRPSRGERARGYSLLEVMVVITMMGVVISLSAPSFQRSLEQSKADIATANLQAIWAAQRMYWLNQRSFAPDVATLVTAGMLDPSLLPPASVDPNSTSPYFTYTISAPSDLSSFTATATRNQNAGWSGSFSIDQTGSLSGSLTSGGQNPIVPTVQ